LHKGKSTFSAAGKQWASGEPGCVSAPERIANRDGLACQINRVIAAVLRWGDNVLTMGGINAVN
jgi:hypothetical protein